jgi:hypothetical protein
VHKRQTLAHYSHHHVKMVVHVLIQSTVIVVNVIVYIKEVIVVFPLIHVQVIHVLHQVLYHVKQQRILQITGLLVHVNQVTLVNIYETIIEEKFLK